MTDFSLADYLKNPCGTSSIPYWKAKAIAVPDQIQIVHHKDFQECRYPGYLDEPYFRLRHDLRDIPPPELPRGFSLCPANLGDYAAHIQQCYHGTDLTEAELHRYTARPVYDATLWLAVRDKNSGALAATGIGELDAEIGEGVLEWIQVSENARNRGLGRYIVCELLQRMCGAARFATVSGRCGNPSHPERLYRSCGFSGSDIWHILRKPNS